MKNNGHKQWFNLSDITGNGSRSIYQNQPYCFQLRCDEEALLLHSDCALNINKMMRIILSTETAKFLHNHIRTGMKIALELMHNDEHMMGFINTEELLHVDRKRVRAVVPLYKFNNEVMMKKCGYDSGFMFKSRAKSNLRRDVSEEEFPILNDCEKQSFIVVELELSKPLNEEIYEDSREALACEVNALTSDEKISCLRKDLRAIVKALLTSELNPSRALLNAISNGEFAQIKDKLLPQIYELATDFADPNELFDEKEFQMNIHCKLTSKILNEQLTFVPLMDDKSRMLLAKFYEALTMRAEADRILLQEIVKNRESETAWMNSGIQYMRRQCYDKATVYIDEVLRINEVSFLGNFLKEFLNLTIGKVNGTKVKRWMEDFSEDQAAFSGLLNNSQEILWDSMSESEKLLSWHDNYIKFAIIFTKLGCYDIAEDAIGIYYSNHGANVNYFYILAAIDAQKGDHGNSVKHLNKIAENDVGNHQVNVNHVQFSKIDFNFFNLSQYKTIVTSICINLMLNNQHANAVELFNKFIDIDDCENFLLLFLLGRFYYQHNMYKNAVTLLSKSSHIFPCDLIFNELGKAHIKLNNLDLAEKNFQLAVNFNCLHTSEDCWKNLFELYEKERRIDAAKLCKINPL